MTILLDPTDESVAVRRQLASRTDVLSGSLALLNISKPRGDVFLARLGRLIAQRFPAMELRSYVKPTYTRPAPPDLRRQIRQENQYVIEALAD